MDNSLVTKNRSELARKLTALIATKPADTSFGLVFVGNNLIEAEISAIKEAAKLCDIVIAVWLPELSRPQKGQKEASFPSDSFQLALQKLGVDIFAHLPKENTTVSLTTSVKNINATIVLQALTTVMPNLVVTPRYHKALIVTLQDIQKNFGDLCVMRVV